MNDAAEAERQWLQRLKERKKIRSGGGCCGCSTLSTEELIEQEMRWLEEDNVLRDVRPWTRRDTAPTPVPNPVYVNVYHLVDVSVNRRLKQLGLGIFHAGVQVFGEEWSYGAPSSAQEVSGVFAVPPMEAIGTLHAHIFVGNTVKTREQVKTLLRRVHCEWLAADYHVLGNNCNHFSARFCELLSTPERPVVFPPWINRIACAGDWFIPRSLATWGVTKITCQEIPKCATVDYTRNTGSDMRAVARQECLVDSVAMQFQIMALMAQPQRHAAHHHNASTSDATAAAANQDTASPPPAPRNLESGDDGADGDAMRHHALDAPAAVLKPPPRPGVSRAAPAVPRPLAPNSGREPPIAKSPSAPRHLDPESGDPNAIASPSQSRGDGALSERYRRQQASRGVTFAPAPAAPAAATAASSPATVASVPPVQRSHVSPLVEPPLSPERPAFASERNQEVASPNHQQLTQQQQQQQQQDFVDGNAVSISLREGMIPQPSSAASEVSQSRESSPVFLRSTTDGAASVMAEPRPATPAPTVAADDDDATFTVDHVQLAGGAKHRPFAGSAAPRTAAAGLLTTIDDLTTSASDATAAKVVTAEGRGGGGGLTTLGTMSQSAGITENNAFLRRGDDDDEDDDADADDGLSMDETATWSHVGPGAARDHPVVPEFSPREAHDS